jgi:hypothetical protein
MERDMPTQYKVVDLNPREGSSHVIAANIEQALNEQARDGWELVNLLEHFSAVDKKPYTGGSVLEFLDFGPNFNTRTHATLVFKRPQP